MPLILLSENMKKIIGKVVNHFSFCPSNHSEHSLKKS